MHNNRLKDLSQARMLHAKDCLKEAEILLNSDEYRGAANRAYYAAFHAIRAILVFDQFDSKKHSGIISKFREIYFKTEIFDKDVLDSISSLFRVQTVSDYDDFYVVSKIDAIEQCEKAKNIVLLIAKYLKENKDLN